MGFLETWEADASDAIDALTNNLCDRLSIFIGQVENVSQSGTSAMNPECKLILANEFQLLLIHLIDRLAFDKGLRPEVRRLISSGILLQLTDKELLLSDKEELSIRDEYYASCTYLFPKVSSDPRALIGRLMLKVKEQTVALNQIDEMVTVKLVADLVVNKELAEADARAFDTLSDIS
jgi:hypothetical protein